MDAFFFLPLILFAVSVVIFCGCFCVCLAFAKKQGRFPTVNRNGPSHGMVNRSGPTFGANRSAFGSAVTHNTPAYNVMVNDEPPFGFPDNNFPATQNNPPIGFTDNDATVHTYGWTTHNIVNEMPPSYDDATRMISESRHQGEHIGFRSDIVKEGSGDDSGKCDSGDGHKDGGTCESGDGGGTTVDSGGGGDSGGTCDTGGDTGGGDSGGGGGDTTTD